MSDGWKISGDEDRRETGEAVRPTRLIVCAAAGDGKRTVIARLLGAHVPADARPDADLRYESFSSPLRQFILADVPASGERWLAGLAATGPGADGALLIIDVSKGLSAEVRRYSYVATLLGVRELTVAINKVDLVGHSEDRFRQIADEYRRFAERVDLGHFTCIPIAALHGENVAASSVKLPWFTGPTLLHHLENVEQRPEISDPTVMPSQTGDRFDATVLWTGRAPMLRGRSYAIRIGGTAATATVAPIRYRLDLESGDRIPATKFENGEVGVVQLGLNTPVAFDPFTESQRNGVFALGDRMTGEHVGTGLIDSAVRRPDNLTRHDMTVKRASRAKMLRQQPTVLWLTGLSGAGKSTLANQIEVELHRQGHLTFLLDGDNVRLGLNADLGFTDEDRAENIRRVAEVARLMADAGLIVIVSFISPFRAEREAARSRFGAGDFLEIHVDTPLAVAEQRDPKGLYKRARNGELRNFTGIDSPYEPPEHPELRIDTTSTSPEQAAQVVIDALERSGRLRTADV